MKKSTKISPWSVVIPVSLGTGLSLLGDASLYTVLPTHFEAAGVTLLSLGTLLSANRFIRLVLNGPMGFIYDRLPRRPLFIFSLFIGAVSTAIYALTEGFMPLLIGRLLWGLAWAGIWVGGNAIILDITNEGNRGRWVGIYQISFFLGTAGGALLGGFLTDWFGYHWAMGIEAGLTFIGVVVALLFLPTVSRAKDHSVETETEEFSENPTPIPSDTAQSISDATKQSSSSPQLMSAMALLGVNRLVAAGILVPTLGFFLLEQMGDSIAFAGYTFGVASITGIALGVTGFISMLAALAIGRWSDELRTRWHAAAGGLVPGVAGFALLALGSPLTILLGLPLTAISGGSNQGLSTAIVGDLSTQQNRGKRLGVLFTIGDLTSAIGPQLAYTVIPLLGVGTIYLLSGGIYGLMLLIAVGWAIRGRGSVPTPLTTP